jgi:hypothetical protein
LCDADLLQHASNSAESGAHFLHCVHVWRCQLYVLGINYVGDNSTNFDGLLALERLIKKIGPPAWVWAKNPALVAAGGKFFCGELRPQLP